MRAIYSALIIGVLVLPGCGGRSDDSSSMAATPVEEATTTDAAEPAAAADDEAARRAPPALVFSVLRDPREGGGGLDADILKVASDRTLLPYKTVPASGVLELDQPCQEGEFFQAEPKVADFLLSELKECGARVEFVLRSTRVAFLLIKGGDEATSRGDLVEVQVNYGEAADMLQFANPAESNRLRILASAAAGRMLGVDQPITTVAGVEQISVEFRDRIRAFQAENHLELTGKLDARTRSSISRLQVRGADVVVAPGPALDVPVAPTISTVTETPPVSEISARTRSADVLTVRPSPANAKIIRANRVKQ